MQGLPAKASRTALDCPLYLADGLSDRIVSNPTTALTIKQLVAILIKSEWLHEVRHHSFNIRCSLMLQNCSIVSLPSLVSAQFTRLRSGGPDCLATRPFSTSRSMIG